MQFLSGLANTGWQLKTGAILSRKVGLFSLFSLYRPYICPSVCPIWQLVQRLFLLNSGLRRLFDIQLWTKYNAAGACPSPHSSPLQVVVDVLEGLKCPPPRQKIKKRASLRFHMKLTWNIKRFSFFPRKVSAFFRCFSGLFPIHSGKHREKSGIF